MGNPEPERVRLLNSRGPGKVGPVGIGQERLDDVDGRLAFRGLVQKRETDGVLEGPLEDGVVLSRQDLDVDGHVRVLPGPVAVDKQRHLHFVAALGSVEGDRDQLQSLASFLGLCDFLADPPDLPDEDAVVTGVGQVWSLTQFYSVDFSKSRISV